MKYRVLKPPLVKELTWPRGINLWCFQLVLNTNYRLKHRHLTASQDFKKEDGNVKHCFEFEWNSKKDR